MIKTDKVFKENEEEVSFDLAIAIAFKQYRDCGEVTPIKMEFRFNGDSAAITAEYPDV